MTALDDAVKAAMDGECELEVVEIAPRWHGDAPDEAIICATHGCDWRDDEPIPCDEHRKVAAAVRAGWAAAIDAATEVAAWPHVETSHEMDVRRECVSNVRALRLPEGASRDGTND